MNEIKLFNLEVKGVTLAEWTIKPNIGTTLKTMLVAGVAVGVGLGAKYAVDWIDDVMHPTYVVSQDFSPPIPDQQPLWQPRTNWDVKYIDGRK